MASCNSICEELKRALSVEAVMLHSLHYIVILQRQLLIWHDIDFGLALTKESNVLLIIIIKDRLAIPNNAFRLKS